MRGEPVVRVSIRAVAAGPERRGEQLQVARALGRAERGSHGEDDHRLRELDPGGARPPTGEEDEKGRGEEIRGALGEQRQAEARSCEERGSPSRHRVQAQQGAHQAHEPEGDHIVVLGRGRLHDAHRDGRARERGEDLAAAPRPELTRDHARPDHAPQHARPLHEVREAVAPRQQIGMQDRPLGPRGLVELADDVGRIERHRPVLGPVGDPRQVVRHRVPVDRYRLDGDRAHRGGDDADPDQHGEVEAARPGRAARAAHGCKGARTPRPGSGRPEHQRPRAPEPRRRQGLEVPQALGQDDEDDAAGDRSRENARARGSLDPTRSQELGDVGLHVSSHVRATARVYSATRSGRRCQRSGRSSSV